MNAKAYNQSMTRLFFGGDPLAQAMRDGLRQIEELVQETRAQRIAQMPEWYSHESSCPCGCGQIGLCDAQLARVKRADDDLPF